MDEDRGRGGRGRGAVDRSGLLQGKAAGRDEAAVSLENSVKILRTEGEIDAATLCADYGLPDDEQAECMRRVRSVSAELETTVYILQNDRLFANYVAAHNCLLSSLGCGK
ncbi:hypothetical protein [Sinorhizobium medicae]|uniref:hypothetical protein n=1 Tax=Sinorhizobium medicae TaxID=110321 RepID=UPI00037C3F2B|nr:hypothetical protein [Sinorhizobium medicae]WQO63626.1 hypothetical protein U8C35_32790 [Sinorhizobium medicae]